MIYFPHLSGRRMASTNYSDTVRQMLLWVQIFLEVHTLGSNFACDWEGAKDQGSFIEKMIYGLGLKESGFQAEKLEAGEGNKV